jgi:phage gp36-like protein
MNYITLNDLYRYIEENKLNQILGNDLILLDGFERRSIDEMTGYLNVRYDSVKCFDNTAKINQIVDILCDLVLYHAHARIMPDMIPELRKERYKEAIGWLEKIADGFISPILPIKQVDPTGPLRWGSSQDKSEMFY